MNCSLSLSNQFTRSFLPPPPPLSKMFSLQNKQSTQVTGRKFYRLKSIAINLFTLLAFYLTHNFQRMKVAFISFFFFLFFFFTLFLLNVPQYLYTHKLTKVKHSVQWGDWRTNISFTHIKASCVHQIFILKLFFCLLSSSLQQTGRLVCVDPCVTDCVLFTTGRNYPVHFTRGPSSRKIFTLYDDSSYTFNLCVCFCFKCSLSFTCNT